MLERIKKAGIEAPPSPVQQVVLRGLMPRLAGEEPAPRGGISYRRGRRAEEPGEARRVPGFDRYGRRVATAEPFSRGAVLFI